MGRVGDFLTVNEPSAVVLCSTIDRYVRRNCVSHKRRLPKHASVWVEFGRVESCDL